MSSVSPALSSSASAVRVVLSHRVRNADGGWHWQPVTAHDQIRVTKNRGKVLRFSVDSPLPYRPTDVDVFLADHEDPAPARAIVIPSLPGVSLSKEGLSLQSISEPTRASSPDQRPEAGSYTSEVIAKLTKISRQLQVYVVINAQRPQPLVGCSVEFQTHNTGKKTSKGEWELNPPPPPHQLKPLLPHHTAASATTPAGAQHSHQAAAQHQAHAQHQQFHQAAGNTSPGHSGTQGCSPENTSSPTYSFHSSPDYESPAGATTSPPHPSTLQHNQQQQQHYNYHYSNHQAAQQQQQQQPPFVPVVQYLQQQQQQQQQHHVWHQHQYAQQPQQSQGTAMRAAGPAAQQQQHFAFHAGGGAAASVPVIQSFPQASSAPSRVVLHRQSQPVHGQPHHYHQQSHQQAAYASGPQQQQQQQQQQQRHAPAFPVSSGPYPQAPVNPGVYPSGDFISNLMNQPQPQPHQHQQSRASVELTPQRYDAYVEPQVVLGSAGSSASEASSSSGGSIGYDSTDALLHGRAGKSMRVDDGSRIRMNAAIHHTGDSDDSDGEHDFYRHPEAVEQRQGGVTVRTGLHVKGLVRAQAFLHYSDLRLKTSVEDVVDAIQTLSQLEGKRYSWRKDVEGSPIPDNSTAKAPPNSDDIDREIAYLQKYVDLGVDEAEDREPDTQPSGVKVLGLIAQEVQKVLPEIVQESADGWLSIDYAEIVPILIEAFKEHMHDYHRIQAAFRDEFESFKGQLRERREKLSVARAVGGSDFTDHDDLSASHESGEETDHDAPPRRRSGREELTDLDSDLSSVTDDGAGECFELEEMPESRPLAKLNFRSKLDVKELAERMTSLIPPRPYNELLHTLRTDKRKARVKQRSYGVAFFSVGTFLLIVNALLAASIPIFIFHLGTAHTGTGTLLYDYSVDTARTYSVSVDGNVVSVEGLSGLITRSSSSSTSSSSISTSSSGASATYKLFKRDQAADLAGAGASAFAERGLTRPTNDKPNDQITCRMVSGDGSDNLIFQSEFSWGLADPRGGFLAVNYIVEIMHIIEYVEKDAKAGYQRGEEQFIFGNSTGKEAQWDSWNLLNRTQNDTKIQNWHAYTKDSIFLVHGGVSERTISDRRFNHNLTSNSIRVDLVITDFPFTSPNTTLALVMRIRSKDPMVLVTAPMPVLSNSSLQINSARRDEVQRPPINGRFGGGGNGTLGGGGGGGGGGGALGDGGGSPDAQFPRAVPSPPAWIHQKVVVDKAGNGTIKGNVQGVFEWPLIVSHGTNISETLVMTNETKSMVVVERLLGDEQDFNAPPSSGAGSGPKELSRVFSFSFFQAPQSRVYRWSFNIGVDNIT